MRWEAPWSHCPSTFQSSSSFCSTFQWPKVNEMKPVEAKWTQPKTYTCRNTIKPIALPINISECFCVLWLLVQVVFFTESLGQVRADFSTWFWPFKNPGEMKVDKGLTIGCCYYPVGGTGKWTCRQPQREGNLSLSDSRLPWQPDGFVSSAALQDSNLPDQGGRETQYLERISSPGCRVPAQVFAFVPLTHTALARWRRRQQSLAVYPAESHDCQGDRWCL